MWSSFLFWYNLSMKLKLCLINIKFYAVVIQSLSHVWHFPMDCNMPGFPVLHYLPEFAQTHFRWVNVAIQPSHPLSPTSPLAFNLSQHQGLFQWVIRWPKYWSFSISSSKEYSGLISFRIDWFDLLTAQGTLKSLLKASQFKSINSLVLSLLHSPTLTSVHDYRKNHNLDYLDLF